MKAKKVLGIVMSAAILGLALFVTGGLLLNKNKSNSIAKETEGIEKEEASGQFEYFWKRRVNPTTGIIDFNDVVAARQQAAAMAASKSADRTQSGLNLQWENLGPDNVGGRTRAICIDRSNVDHMYAGGVSGGLWQSYDHGLTWTIYDNHMANMIISCITQAANGDVYVGTGEGTPFTFASGILAGGFQGNGIYKSTDHGATFNLLPSTANQTPFSFVQQLGSDPTNANKIYAATAQGLRVSYDGGDHWYVGVRFNGATGVLQTGNSSVVRVGSDGTVICAIGSQLYKSNNGDTSTYNRLTNISTTGVGRVEVAISPSNPNVMYAALASSATNGLSNIIRSTDKFASYTIIGPGGGSFEPFGNQASYDMCIAVAPNNPNRIIVGGLVTYRWDLNGNWTQISGGNFNTYVHADQHCIIFNPNDANNFFIGCDGGIYESKDQGTTFTGVYGQNKKYTTTQFYTMFPSPLPPVGGFTTVIGGTQDNGCLTINNTGNNPQDAATLYGANGNGDGFFTAISTYNPSAFFFEAQYGVLYRSSNAGNGAGSLFYDSHVTATGGTGCFPSFSDNCFAPFSMPFLLWENLNPSLPMDTSFFVGLGSSVWMTKSALNFSVSPKWYEIASSAKIQGAGSCMAITSDGKTLFYGTDANKVYRISGLDYITNNLDTSGNNYNMSAISTPVTVKLIYSSGQLPTSISVDPNDNNHVIITLGNYSNASYVRNSVNALVTNPTFNDITNNLPKMPVYASLIDKWNSNRILVGTELGVYTSLDAGATWVPDNNGMSLNPVSMLRQVSQYTNGQFANDIYASTYGRGIYKTTTLTGFPTTQTASKLQVSVYPNPANDITNVSYSISSNANVTMEIYNISGQKVITQNLGIQTVGNHTVPVSVATLPSGTYIMNLTIGDTKSATRFIIQR
ncbi:MAG: T9SS type A sorting domain-containing protein [Bacteroidota bacterium]